MHLHIPSLLSGAAIYGALAYGARTFPVPGNKYGRWLLGLVQYVLSNKEKAEEAFNSAKQEGR